MAKLRKPRWGRLSDIDRRIRVGSASFNGQPRHLQHLIAWRRMHKLRAHRTIHDFSRRIHGVSPSSNMSVGQKVAFVARKEG